MGYKSIATILHSNNLGESALEHAIKCAREWNAHLHVACIGIDDSQIPSYFAAGEAIAARAAISHAREEAQTTAVAVKARLDREDISWDVRAAAHTSTGLDSYLEDHMRLFDLVILPRPYGETSSRLDVEVFEACLFAARRPVIVVPPEYDAKGPLENIMVAWDDGAEALAAVRQALPLIADAKKTDVTMISPASHSADRSDPGGRLAEYLARHGGHVEINVLARTQGTVAAQLLQRASEQQIDMIVMGAYGHSRMREALLGGATRQMLQMADLPIFMARR